MSRKRSLPTKQKVFRYFLLKLLFFKGEDIRNAALLYRHDVHILDYFVLVI